MALEFPQNLKEQLKALAPALQMAQKIWMNLQIKVKHPADPNTSLDLTAVMQELLNRAAPLTDLTNQYAKNISDNQDRFKAWIAEQIQTFETSGIRNDSIRAEGYRNVLEALETGKYLHLEDDSDIAP